MAKLFNMNKQAQQPVQAAAEIDTLALMSEAQTEGGAVATQAPVAEPKKGSPAKKIVGIVMGAIALGTGIFLLGRKSGKNSVPVNTGYTPSDDTEEDDIIDDVDEDSET